MSRRSKAQWRELISQQQSSLTAAEFCRRESINPKYFSTRKVELTEAASSFVEIVSPTTQAIDTIPSTIHLRVIELEVSTDRLSNVLKQL